MLHGTADATTPTDSTVLYDKMAQAKMREQGMYSSTRFYLVPGFGHRHGVFDAGFNALGVLDRRVATEVAPKYLVAAGTNNNSYSRTRTLCAFPAWPQYMGFGDVNAPSSFVCVTK